MFLLTIKSPFFEFSKFYAAACDAIIIFIIIKTNATAPKTMANIPQTNAAILVSCSDFLSFK